ncbi:MAG: RluA family pseudouridine synthase [Myxococcota bacterium]
MDPPAPIEIVVVEAEAGERLDRILAERPLGHSRSTLQRWIGEGRVAVDGVVADRRTRPRAGARVVVHPAPLPASEAEPQDIPLAVLHEDADLIVVDKPAGLVVHPAPGHPDRTLVNALLHHTGVAGGRDAARPGIVHRLDKDTSGVMVVAKTPAAHERLVEAFQAHAIERAYLAIAVGAPPAQATLDTLHGRHPVHRKRFTARVARGKRAVTHVRVLERLHGAALVECRLETGRTHQIRVHLAEQGTPVLGDSVYGRSPRDPVVREAARALGRQALHAGVLGFVHPVTGETLTFETPPPADFERALGALRVSRDAR